MGYVSKFRSGAVVLLASLALLLFAVLPLIRVQAQGAGQGLEISPPLLDLKADPGQTLQAQIKLRNVTGSTLVARAQYDDFVATGEEGQPKLLLDSKEQSPYTIKEWLNSIPSVTLAPQQQKTVDLIIKIPNDASPGGHYGVIRFTGAPPEVDETAVSLSASIGTLVLVNVSGDVKEEAKIIELFTSQNGKKRGLFEYGPITLTTRVENTGNVHIQPTGTTRITNMFGREVQSYKFNETRGNVLPASVRKFESELKKKLLFGKYTVQSDLVFGADSKIISARHTFWVIPYKLIAIVLVGLALLVFFIRQYNRFVVSRAQRKETHGATKKKTKK